MTVKVVQVRILYPAPTFDDREEEWAAAHSSFIYGTSIDLKPISWDCKREIGLTMIIWLLAVSLVTSAMGGMLGMASGVFIVPILAMSGTIDIQTAIGASLISVIACSCASAPHFLSEGLVNIRLAAVLEVASTAGALTGVFLMGLIATNVLYLLFAAVMIVSAYQMFANRREVLATNPQSRKPEWQSSLRLDGVLPSRNGAATIPYHVQRLPLGMSLMYGAGVLSALLGIGSGVLKIPAMDTALRLPIKISSATSNFMIGVTATASAGAYFLQGSIDTEIAGPVAIGSVLGSIAGAKLLSILPARQLRIVFVVILLGLSIQMLLTGLGIDLVGVSA